jgi:multidrug resistance efflux pump
MVWLVAVLGVIGLFHHQTRQIQVVGLARAPQYRVAPTARGRIREIHVQLFEAVTQGQNLVTLDILTEDRRILNQHQIAELEAERETLRSKIEFLRAQHVLREEQLVDQIVRAQSNRAGDERIFSVGVESARMQVLDIERQLATERVNLARVQDEVATLTYLSEQKAVAPFELEQARIEQQRLEQVVAKYEGIQTEAQQNLKEAKQRQEAFVALPHSPLATDVNNIAALAQRMRRVTDMEIATQRQRLHEIDQRLQNLNQPQLVQLKAPFDGIVSQLPLSMGEVVDVNVPVLHLAGQAATEVIAYIPGDQSDRLQLGMTVDVVKNSQPQQFMQGCEVIAIGPTIEQVPAQLWQHPSMPQWGRAFLIRVPAELQLLAGEKVGIRRL